MKLTEHLKTRLPWTRSVADGQGLTPEQRQSWADNGYLVFKGLFSREYIDSINEFIEELWDRRQQSVNPLVIDIFIGTEKEKRVFFREAPEAARTVPYKLNDLYLEYELIRETVLSPVLSDVLTQLLDGAPLVRNTLNLEFGSQQRFHFDTFYMPPKVPDKMVASWIALEEANEENGPLQYYPGSHQIPPYHFSHGKLNAIEEEMPDFDRYIEKELEKRKIEPVQLMAEPGDVLIWHAQLYHGGSAIRQPGATRRSLVTHYYRAQDYLDRVWRIKDIGEHRYYYRRRHQSVL